MPYHLIKSKTHFPVVNRPEGGVMELHFYPGQKLLIIKDGGKITRRFEAWGGPSTPVHDPRMWELPTIAGTYIIHFVRPYTTPSWPMSKIAWGTALKDMPAQNDVWYKLNGKKWGSVKNDIGIGRSELISYYHSLYGKHMVPKSWVFNDFGPLSVRFFKDLNGNRRLDRSKGEVLSGEMIHTTPENEAQASTRKKVILVPSHGCIHIKPQDRNILMALGAFNSGTSFIVHKYSEKI
jgi:hypothetical protein